MEERDSKKTAKRDPWRFWDSYLAFELALSLVVLALIGAGVLVYK